MEKDKTDRRVRKTKARLLESLMTLMQEKDIKDISVKELSDLADINRGTFYLHYRDTQELLDSIVQELVGELDAVIRKYPPQELKDNPFPVIYEAFSAFARHADFLPFLQQNGNPELLDKLKELISEMLYTEWLPMHSEQKPEDYPYINAFLVSGITEVFRVWVQSGMKKSARDLAALIQRLALEGI